MSSWSLPGWGDAVRGSFPGRVLLDRAGAAFAADRERWPLWIPVFFAAGIAGYFALTIEPPYWVGLSAALGFVLLWRLTSRFAVWRAGFLVLAFAATGFAAAQWRTEAVSAPVLERAMGPVTISGQVIRVEQRPRAPRILLDRLLIRGLTAEETPARIRLRLRKSDRLAVGDRIELRARLSPPSAPAMPGAYDFQRRAWFERIGAVGFALTYAKPAERVGSGRDVSGFWLALSDLRQRMAERIRAAVPGPTGAVAAALLVGDRSAIPEDVSQAMRDSGLAHLLAISGLHLGLVAAILFFGARFLMALSERLALGAPIKKWAAAIALAGAFGYLLLAGATVPTQRAFVMTGIVLLAVMLDRSAISLRLVAWAAMIVLVIAPESVMGPSFQMSFAAVLALVAAYERLHRPMRDWLSGGGLTRRAGLYIAGVAISTVIAGAATGLIGLHHFGRVSQYGIVANLLAVPVAGFWIMPWGILACVLMPLGLEAVALIPMAVGIDWVLSVAQKVASWPGAVSHVPAMPPAGLAVAAFGGIWLCLWSGRIRWIGVVGIAIGLLAVPLWPRPDVIVAESGRLAAARLPDGSLGLSTTRVEKFAAKIWLEQDGQTEPSYWPRNGETSDWLACDPLGCQYEHPVQPVAFVWDGRALVDDCRSGWVVVSAVPVRWACRGAALVIDRFDLWRDGAHAIWLEKSSLKIVSDRAYRGDRPWVRRPKLRER